jgi:hypothetical protein
MQSPSTYRRNTKDIPIDGIWATYSLDLIAGGYLGFDEVVIGADHPTLWIDISYNSAFGYEGTAPISKPSARRLNNQNPRIRHNFNQRCKEHKSSQLIERIVHLEASIQGEMTPNQIMAYKALLR